MTRQIKTSFSGQDLFLLFKDRAHCFFLDSAIDHGKLGRYSLIGFDPFVRFSSKNGQVRIEGSGLDRNCPGNPFHALQDLLRRFKSDYCGPLPFVGGAVGYLAYDLCHHIEDLPRTAIDDIGIPDCFFGFYDGAIILDHLKDEVTLASPGLAGDPEKWVNDVEKVIVAGQCAQSAPMPVSGCKCSPLRSNFTKSAYLEAVNRVKDYIEAGDIYQANLTQRFSGQIDCPSPELYCRLRQVNPAPFACYLDFGDGQILSSSPERFIQVRNRKVQTRPIKGTRPRWADPAADLASLRELLASEKDRAELLMIVDLVRNDLGRVSKTGSVKVTELFHPETYATVHHLVATVESELDEGYDTIDCLVAAFPGGSITGAPKIRAMEIIDELEPTQRNIYTGSIGYIGFNGDADFNIVIRTILKQNDRVCFQVGGGIVWDSDAEQEYLETRQKGKALMQALGTTDEMEV